LFRLTAVLLSLLPLLVIELSLRSLDWPRPTEVENPYVGFDNVLPLFVRNDSTKQFEIAEERQVFFCADSFAIEKPADEFRVFCLGGSTVQGRPYENNTAFSKWLELEMKARQPGRQYRVVNCGGVSYASYRLLPILKEVIGYEPDLIIVYTGHNEFLEDRSYGDIRRTNRFLVASHRRLSGFKSYQAIQRLWNNFGTDSNHDSPDPTRLPTEVDAMLDYQQGLKEYHRDDDWHAGVESHFEYNLQQMVDAAHEADVPLLLVRPVANLASCVPFKSEFSEDSSVEVQKLILAQLAKPLVEDPAALASRRQLLEETVALDVHYAMSHFRLGECYWFQGEKELALQSFLRAKDEDVCPLRMKEVMDETLERIARTNGVHLVDVRSWFEQHSEQKIVDDYWMIDHVHPKIDGHKKIANLIANDLEKLGMIQAETGWEERRDTLFRENVESLNFGYFERGSARLKTLKLWTKGIALKAKPRKEEEQNAGK